MDIYTTIIAIIAIWGAGLSTILAIIKLIGDRHNIKFEFDECWCHSSATDSPTEGLFVNIRVRNKGKKTAINKITLSAEGLDKEFGTTEEKAKPIPGEENESYYPSKNIQKEFPKGKSELVGLHFLDEKLVSFLGKNREKEIKFTLNIHDTYKVNKIDFMFKPKGFYFYG